MPKKTKDKTVWLPKEFAEDLEKDFEKNKEIYEMLEITSVGKLIRILARLGKPQLQTMLGQLSELSASSSDAISEIRGELDKRRKEKTKKQQLQG